MSNLARDHRLLRTTLPRDYQHYVRWSNGRLSSSGGGWGYAPNEYSEPDSLFRRQGARKYLIRWAVFLFLPASTRLFPNRSGSCVRSQHGRADVQPA